MEKKYFEVEIIKNDNICLEKFFHSDDIKKSNNKLQLTNKSIYAISKYYDAQWITDIILNNCQSNLTITDCTAGVGGNIINFSKNFQYVYGVELNSVTFNVLKNNINCLQLKNVNLKNDNVLNLISLIKSDIVFVDPPWGGTLYKKIKYFNLKLGKLPISYLINKFYENKTIKHVVLKCPYNINTTHLFKYSNYNNIQIFKNNHIWLIIFSN